MTDKAISPLRRRLIEDMTIRRLSPNTQHQYIRHVKSFADFVGRSPDKTTAEYVHRYQPLECGSPRRLYWSSHDSSLEGDGFELPVPRQESPGFPTHSG